MSKLNPKGTLVRKKLIQVVTKYQNIERQFQEIKRYFDHSYWWQFVQYIYKGWYYQRWTKYSVIYGNNIKVEKYQPYNKESKRVTLKMEALTKNDNTKRRKDSALKNESDMKSLMEDSKNKTNKQKRSQLDWNRRLSRVKTKI